jgi:hypothetical protein
LDDLKLIREREEKFKTYLLTVGNFSDYIHMEFGFEKSAKIVPKRHIISLTNLILTPSQNYSNLYRESLVKGKSEVLYQQTKESFKRE